MVFEYSVVPAPKKGMKAKGIKTTEDRFAHALQQIMNEKGADGWDYVRTDTLPTEERQGLTGRTTVYQNMMVFKRPLTADAPETDPVSEEDPPLFLTSQREPDVDPDVDQEIMERVETAALRAERPTDT